DTVRAPSPEVLDWAFSPRQIPLAIRVRWIPDAYHRGPRSGSMYRTFGRLTMWLAAAAITAGLSSVAAAHVVTGRRDVTVEGSAGGRLPGASVELTGPLNQSQVTDAQGQAHFLNLPVGIYAIKAALEGFNAFANDRVEVVSGASTPISAKLGIAGTAETV